MKVKPRKCDFCHSEEGKERFVGKYIVELREIGVSNKTKLACQGCYRKIKNLNNKQYNEDNMMKTILKRMLKMIGMLSITLLLVIIGTTLIAYGQSAPGLPGFPSEPSAAPIDGGLGILAAAGGAYALKKLRGKKGNKEIGE